MHSKTAWVSLRELVVFAVGFPIQCVRFRLSSICSGEKRRPTVSGGLFEEIRDDSSVSSPVLSSSKQLVLILHLFPSFFRRFPPPPSREATSFRDFGPVRACSQVRTDRALSFLFSSYSRPLFVVSRDSPRC